MGKRMCWPAIPQGALWLYPGNGRGGWLARVKAGTGWNGFTAVVGPGDMNGDGKADVLARDTTGALWLYPGNGRGGWLARVKAGTGWNGFTAIVGAGDMSGDRKADVLARDSGGTLWLYRGNGRGGFGSRTSAGSGWNAMASIVATPGTSTVTAGMTSWPLKRPARSGCTGVTGRGGWLGRTQAGSGWN
jgi:serine protease